MADYGAVVVGAGHNGLAAAFYLARSGLRTLVLERSDAVGGACRTDELFPGYRFSTCAHSFVLFHPKVLADMRLADCGLEVYPRDPMQLQPFPSGACLTFWQDRRQTLGIHCANFGRRCRIIPPLGAVLGAGCGPH